MRYTTHETEEHNNAYPNGYPDAHITLVTLHGGTTRRALKVEALSKLRPETNRLRAEHTPGTHKMTWSYCAHK